MKRNINEIKQIINEVFESLIKNYTIKRKHPLSFKATFITKNGFEYNFDSTISNKEDDKYKSFDKEFIDIIFKDKNLIPLISFNYKGSFEKTNFNNSIEVLLNVFGIVDDYINLYPNEKVIVFSPNSLSKDKIYEFICNKYFSDKFEYVDKGSLKFLINKDYV
jgi:hypothetical protein